MNCFHTDPQQMIDIINRFTILGKPVSFEFAKKGKINTTYFFTCENNNHKSRYVIQKINTNIFRNWISIMNNISEICAYHEQRNNFNQRMNFLEIVLTRQGNLFVENNHEVWRCYKYIEDSCHATKEKVNFFGAGWIVGSFHYTFINFPIHRLETTIPNFHDFQRRANDFDVILSNCKTKRKDNARNFIKRVEDKRNTAAEITTNLKNQNLPLRIVHNDTSLENILFDVTTNEPICLIDLDTVMPGYIINDFGDLVRDSFSYITNINDDIAYLSKGYLSAVHSFITREEIECLYWGIWTITFELGLRFITDYLNNDSYFGADFEQRNLNNAINQFDLLELIENNELLFRKIINMSIGKGEA